MHNVFDVIVIGAGYSGLCASYHLKRLHLHHIVFERHKIGDSWRSQRWDNFRFNSTNRLNVLPGEEVPDGPDSFGTAPAFVSELENYVTKHQLPVKENSKVISVDKPDVEDREASCACPVCELDLKEHNINTVIWSTGFTHDYSFIKLPAFDQNANLVHKTGIPLYPGLYFLGHPWLRNKRSTILFGIIEDVELVVSNIYSYSN